ncbi:hypothetical protein DFJ74DRAFT_709410 [Hyaloraphidium curvatum]|nr:hypothetical protein DFJ74DRAFT_709410 [Hyaloraphidium curvatum]
MSGNKGDAEDVLSFLDSLEEMTAARPAGRAASPSKAASPTRAAGAGQAAAPPSSAADVLSFLDEITAGAAPGQQASPTQPPPALAARAQSPASAPAPPPVAGFVAPQRAPAAHAPRSRHIPPPDTATLQSPLSPGGFVPAPLPPGDLPPEPEPVPEPENADDKPASSWTWGSLLSTGSKLLETATQQVKQNVGAGEKAVVEQMKKMGLAPEKIREAVGNVMDQIAPPLGRQPRGGGPMMYVYFPVILDEAIAEYVPELATFCSTETFGRGGAAGREFLGGEPVVKNITDWGQQAESAIPEGMEMAAVNAETTLENLSRSIQSHAPPPAPDAEQPPAPLYLVIQPFLAQLPPPLRSSSVVVHTAYLCLLHRPGREGEALHLQCLSQSVPTAASLHPGSDAALAPWLAEQKLRALEAALYSTFEAVAMVARARLGTAPSPTPSGEKGGWAGPKGRGAATVDAGMASPGAETVL